MGSVRPKRMLFAVLGIGVAVVLCVALKLFVVGEPVDGTQLHWTTTVENQTLTLRAESVESTMALRGWKQKQEGGTLSITGRKVLVSPLFSNGSYQTSIPLDGVEEIHLGGRIIWPNEG